MKKVGSLLNLVGAGAVLLAASVVLVDQAVHFYSAAPWALLIQIAG